MLGVTTCLVLLQKNPSKGWWEKFIGPGCALDTDRYYVVCANVLGGCYGSSGPSSINPTTGKKRLVYIRTINSCDGVVLFF